MKIWSDYPVNRFSLGDKGYPGSLRKLNNPPKQIYYRGELKRDTLDKAIAVVGTRKMTRYGRVVLEHFIPEFVAQKVVVVSGFMYGVDAVAHELTVGSGGVTVAVLGNGINSLYPPENDKLYTKILREGGLVLSEYKPEMKPKLWSYVQRNRIVAALATLGVLVVEAGEKSGALITAKNAKELGREVYVIPGPINSSVSAGTNNLIKNGRARVATDAGDIKGLKSALSDKKIKLSGLEALIYKELEGGEIGVDELAAALGKDVIEIGNSVSLMSLKGIISEVGGKYYVSTA